MPQPLLHVPCWASSSLLTTASCGFCRRFGPKRLTPTRQCSRTKKKLARRNASCCSHLVSTSVGFDKVDVPRIHIAIAVEAFQKVVHVRGVGCYVSLFLLTKELAVSFDDTAVTTLGVLPTLEVENHDAIRSCISACCKMSVAGNNERVAENKTLVYRWRQKLWSNRLQIAVLCRCKGTTVRSLTPSLRYRLELRHSGLR